MNEIIIECNLKSPENNDAIIEVLSEPEKNLLYKFIVGYDGAWETLKDFSEEKSIIWKPKEDGEYILMVQAKKVDSKKAFDYVSRRKFSIGALEKKIIKNIYLDKKRVSIGDKVTITVDVDDQFLLFRYMVKENEKWILAKDYCTENKFIWSANLQGKHEILVQCKSSCSEEKFQDAMKIEFEVVSMQKVEIVNFKCLNSSKLIDDELVFEVQANCDDNRTTLYKFIKLDNKGQAKCIQDYCTKKMVSYIEKNSGKYKLLCLAKDMYSPKTYDDRALLYYDVKPYKSIKIESFTSDLSSPQIVDKDINFKAIVSGGRDIRYRFIVEGEENKDTRYLKCNTFTWSPTTPGTYNVKLWVKDVSSMEKHEACESLQFIIDHIPREPIKIKDVIVNRQDKILIGQSVNVRVNAEGGVKHLYGFTVKKDNIQIEKIDYGECNWVNFIPESEGRYDMEVRVKDIYSDKEFDSHSIVSIQAFEYIPAKIDYVLLNPKEYYIVGDQVVLNVIARDTKNTLLKYVLRINGHKVEETDYIKNKKYIINPKCSGKYNIKIYAKNKKSKKEFDTAKDIDLIINEAPPITNTILKCDTIDFCCNESINIMAENCGGKDVVYEFYLMEKGEWNLVQNYSKKNYYTFMPFSKGKYSVLVLVKSSTTKLAYEDYSMIDMKVGEKIPTLSKEEIDALYC